MDKILIEEQKGLEREYQNLREELNDNTNRIFDLLKSMVTVTTAILSLGFTDWFKGDKYIFLVPIFLISAVSLIINSQQKSSERLASYLRVFIEPKLSGYNWETNLNEFRNTFKHKSIFRISISALSGGLCLICYFLFYLAHSKVGSKPLDNTDYLFLFLTLILLIISILKLNSRTNMEYEEKWKILLEKE